MNKEEDKIIWTIGHSTHSIQEFIAILKSFDIELVADIRNFPGSKRYPHFNKEVLETALCENNVQYIHLKDLGGRRKPKPDSINTPWRNSAFRGYADYMESDLFKDAVKILEKNALKSRTAFMCSEAVWWRCHRSLVSDYLKVNGWKVMHISGVNKETEHPYTSPAKIVGGKLSYAESK
jgi:uncharacterized protein (DUF488 family)